MKKIKNLLTIMLALVMAFTLVACESSTSLTMNVETGDSIEVRLDTSEGLSMKWDKNENVLKVSDDDSLVLSMYFSDASHLTEWIDGATGATNVDVKENGSGNGTKRSIIFVDSVDDGVDDGVESASYIVAWIVGSNTGLIVQGTDSNAETKEVFESLTFSIESTDQDDEYYFLESVIMENVVDDDQPTVGEDEQDETEPATEPIEEDDEIDETDPDVTEPEKEDEEDEKKEDDKNDEQEKDPVDNSTLSSDWKDFQFSIDGHVLSLPCTYKELKEATGYSMKSAEEKSYLEPGYYTSVQLRDADGEGVCYIDVLNNNDEDTAYADCIVITISQSNYQEEKKIAEVKFAGGLSVGDVTSKEDLIEMFGEPTEIYEYRVDETEEGYEDWGKYETDTYTWSEDSDWTTMNFIEIEMNINTGIIEKIRVDHSYFK